MKVRFWGTRGSIAKPGPGTTRYGGNTSCIEVRSDSGTLVIIDCGTGSHTLGQQLCAESAATGNPVRGHLLISHTHWDHIQGLPFFAPLFVPGNEWDIYGPRGLSSSLRTTLAGQMEHTYFPISIDQLAARIDYHDLVEGQLRVGDIEITTHFLNHPALTLGYRLEVDGASVVYCCDHEPHSIGMADGAVEISGQDLRHVDFVAGADLVIHDAQYTAAEYEDKIGWGHSPGEYAVRVCRDAGVRQLALTHHDPLRDDAAVDEIMDSLRADLQQSESALDILAAAEGLCIELRGSPAAAEAPPIKRFRADALLDVKPADRMVLICARDDELASALASAATAEGFSCHRVADAVELLDRVHRDQPAVVLIAHAPPREDGIALIHSIRAATVSDEVQVPAVLVAERENASETADDVVTDWLVMPFSENYARTKIRAWVLRTSCRWIRAQVPDDESVRLSALKALHILDTPREERFDSITRITAAAMGVPVALVSLVDSNRQWFKSCFGLDASETPRDQAFCAHVVHERTELVVPDTMQDERFADNPLVADGPRIRFYAGAPLILKDGSCIGTLCLLDVRPRNLSESELVMLRDMRDLVLKEMQSRDP